MIGFFSLNVYPIRRDSRAYERSAMRAADYLEFYRTLVAEKSIRPGQPTHPRLAIWDPFEARLRQRDVVILGSLNEGTWPQAAEPGPWLNRAMRADLGLPAPEFRRVQGAAAVTSSKRTHAAARASSVGLASCL